MDKALNMFRDIKNPFENAITTFKGWSLITSYLRNQCTVPERRLRTNENLQNWLDSGLIEEVPFHPDFNRHVVMSDESIEKFIWLKPTDIGLACHFIHMQLRDQRDATTQAYQDGKTDALKALVGNMAQIMSVDVEDLRFTEDDE